MAMFGGASAQSRSSTMADWQEAMGRLGPNTPSGSPLDPSSATFVPGITAPTGYNSGAPSPFDRAGGISLSTTGSIAPMDRPGWQPDPLPIQVPKIRRRFGDPGGLGDKLALFGEYFLAANGNPLGQILIQQRHQRARDAAEDARWQQRFEAEQAERLAEASRPRYFQGSSPVIRIGPDGAPEQVYTPPPEPQKPTALQQQVEYLRSLNPNLSDADLARIAERGIGGYAYSPEAQQQRIATEGAVAGVREAARARHRASKPAAPKYEYRMGPGGKLQRRRIG